MASTSQEPITESVSSEATEIDQKVDTTTATSPVINILPSIGLSSTPNDILVESETEKPIPTTTPEASSTTTESVKLVEDSATEILLTTAPANLSTLSVPNTRINTASVSQPRPFSFNRRNRPTTEPTTTPLPPSNDQTRSKVSISSRNQTRSSFLVGRDRLRPRQENAGRNEPTTENEQIESSRGGVVKETAHTRGRSKSRGVSRYTPPTFRVRNEDSSNSVVRERIRTTEPPVSTAIATDASRTRFRRPIAKTTTESTKANELEDSPIVRIAQGYPRRSLSSRSKNTVKDEIDNDKITNIKVFKKPTALNRDVYARTRYTRKRNNVEIGEFKKETEEKTSEAAPDFFYSSTSTTTTDSIVDRSLNDTTIPIIITTTERPIVNSIDETDKVLSPMTISPETQETTITGLDTETNTVEAVRTTELTIENEVNTETDDRVDASEGLDQVLTTTDSAIKLQDFEPNVIIVLPANNTETVNEENINLAVPRRRKVLLRRRPVTSSTTATSQAEQEENKLIPRRRKVIKRVRPVQSTVSTVDADSSTEKDQILLRFRSTTPREDATSTIVAETSDVSTENFGLSTTETVTAETIDLDITDGFTGVTLETSTAETAISDTGFSESDVVTMASTIIDNVTAVVVDSTTSKEEWTVETGATESTTSSNFLINFTDANDISDETLPSRNELDALPTTISQLTTPSAAFQSNRRLETYNRTYYLDSRYVRKKFVRRRPVASSSSSSENVTNDWYPNIETSSHVPLTSERNEVGLSKRRKSLFVRRRPVSSTTARTTGFIEEDFIDENKFGDEKELQLEVRRNVENATPRINRAYDETFYPITPSAARESEEFWNRYTTPSTSERRSPFPVTVQSETTLDKSSANVDESSENEESHRSVSFNNRSPEIRPRYRVPESLKKTASVEGLYSLDSLPEESGESNNHKSRYQNFRQPRTRYKYREITRNQREENEESLADATHSPSFDSSTQVRTRFYARRPVPSTEPPVTETLIPAKKFDYVADAYRRQQSLRTTPRNQNEEADSTTWTSLNEERAEVQNFVDGDYVTTPSSQPLVTRLVTSVEESATTERQKILIKTKYSSLTSNTKIPLQITIARLEHPATTASPISDTLERSTDSLDESEGNEDESVNEIRQGQVERSTLPIEGEFLHQARFTTESHESSTIEIESVFNNLIGSRDSTK